MRRFQMPVDRRPLLLLEVPLSDVPDLSGFLMEHYIADSPLILLTQPRLHDTREDAKEQVRDIGRQIADDLNHVTAGLFITHWMARMAHTDTEIEQLRGKRPWSDVLYVGWNSARAKRLEALGCQTARLGPDDTPWDLKGGTPILDSLGELSRYWQSLAAA